MKKCESQREAIVAGVYKNHVSVCLSEPKNSANCAGCALAFACSNVSGERLIVDAGLPEGDSDLQLTPGSKVTVEPIPGAKRKAVFMLLVIPLAVFIAVACAATLSDMDQGLVALLSLLSSALTFPALHFYVKLRPQPQWRIVLTLKTNLTD
ncbi:MAG: SoxR reducing system RseC family protein [Bacteroidales bacterium]|nr:SoxR reducing system RseC family protein [Bacteroidales bacterium]